MDKATAGARLRARREAEGWSRPELARRMRSAADEQTLKDLSKVPSLTAMIKQWETGQHKPSSRYETLVRLAFAGDSRQDDAETTGIVIPVTPASYQGPVAPELIDYFQTQLSGHYQADMMLGPRALIGTVSAQSDLIGQLLDAADGTTRQRLTEVGTAYRAFVGWLYLDAGDADLAARWHGSALELAHRSGNREAISCTLVDLAMAHTDRQAGRAAADLCVSALQDAHHIGPEVRVFALQQQAHGISLLPGRDRAEVDRLLDDAGALVGQVDHEEWGTACRRTPNYVEIQRATCYGRLGLADEASRLWDQLIPSQPGSSLRDVGVWTARHATARAQANDPDHAVDLARRAVSMAVTTGSARARRELGKLEQAMRPWQDAPVSRDLAEILAPAKMGT